MSFFKDEIVDEEPINHKFIIKYKFEEERKEYGKLLLNMIQKYELKNFSVVEEKAYTQGRIMYNEHTIIREGDSFTKEKIEKIFLEFLKR